LVRGFAILICFNLKILVFLRVAKSLFFLVWIIESGETYRVLFFFFSHLKSFSVFWMTLFAWNSLISSSSFGFISRQHEKQKTFYFWVSFKSRFYHSVQTFWHFFLTYSFSFFFFFCTGQNFRCSSGSRKLLKVSL
jgi:hypothetical protein